MNLIASKPNILYKIGLEGSIDIELQMRSTQYLMDLNGKIQYPLDFQSHEISTIQIHELYISLQYGN